MGRQVAYREAVPGDSPAIGDIHAQNFCANNKQPFSASLSREFSELWRSRITAANDGLLVLVATDGEVIAGFVCAYGAEHSRWGSLVDNLHVSPATRNEGIGTALLQRVILWLREYYGEEAVYLLVLESNVVARSLYEKHGGLCVEYFSARTHSDITVRNCRYIWENPHQMVVT